MRNIVQIIIVTPFLNIYVKINKINIKNSNNKVNFVVSTKSSEKNISNGQQPEAAVEHLKVLHWCWCLAQGKQQS